MHRRTFLKGLSLGGAWLAGCRMMERMVQPDGGILANGGGMIRPGGGMVAPVYGCNFNAVSPAAQFALLEAGTGATLAAAMGLGAQTPAHYAILSGAAGGADKVGAGDLDTAASTPLFQVANTTLGINTVHLDSALDAVTCGSGTSDWDVGDESMTLLYIGTLDSFPGNNKYLVSKGTTATGYCIRTKSTGALEWTTFNPLGSVVTTISHNHYTAQLRGDLVAVLATSDQNANLSQSWSHLGASSSGTAQNNSSTIAVAFGVGSVIGSTHPGKPGLVALWKGANAEGIRETNLTQLINYLGLGIYDDVL